MLMKDKNCGKKIKKRKTLRTGKILKQNMNFVHRRIMTDEKKLKFVGEKDGKVPFEYDPSWRFMAPRTVDDDSPQATRLHRRET